ncbi:MAG: hypothetical protein EFKGCFLK_02339 [Rhodocyclaceae bacterium]|nr:MAG: DUF2207 domain-containing protein [Rhodocyclaceae bacterium]MBV6408738.1 hypothetical protein [Rhodocyclaceae bacterium]CAG0946521.1 hypothetical protein GPROT2_03787 [Gammaproteobacteria bacterium]
MRRLLLVAVLWTLTFSAPASQFGGETIREYDALIEVGADGALEVTETILVNAEGREIKRGIFRDFPTLYRSWHGRAVAPFEVLSVKRNGAAEPWHTEERQNGVRLYAGRTGHNIARGLHRYEIRYRTGWQIGFFADRDELYWNVTGNGWSFIIERATAAVVLPRALPEASLRLEAYTGHAGEKGGDWRARVDAEGRARFMTTAPLMPNQGLTIVVGWPKGMVAEPTREQHLARWVHDNPEWRAGLPGLALLLFYYLVVWHRYGRDPAGGTVIPRFAPPKDVSAADARFLDRRGYDERVFAAAVVALAVKGQLRIREEDRDYTLERPKEAAAEPLFNDEKTLLGALGLAPGGALPLRSENAAKVGAAHKALKDALKKEHLKQHFVTNGKYLVPGLIGSFLVLVVATFQASQPDPLSLFMLFWLTGWTFGVYMIVSRAVDVWRQALAGKWLLAVPALMISAFALPFIGGEVAGLYVLFTQGSPLMAALLLMLVGVNYLFYRLLQAPTLAGRRLLDELAGFRMYLEVAEKDGLRARRGPNRTLALFEKYLPYALALGVENAWAEQFSDILSQARGAGGADAVPRWYSGSSWDAPGSGFAGALAGGLSGAIASASSSPGSSSGGGGGGSSGGGGGGGGGGGW